MFPRPASTAVDCPAEVPAVVGEAMSTKVVKASDIVPGAFSASKVSSSQKLDDLQYDLGNLAAVDSQPLDEKRLRKHKESYLQDTATEAAQLLITQIFSLPIVKGDAGPYVCVQPTRQSLVLTARRPLFHARPPGYLESNTYRSPSQRLDGSYSQKRKVFRKTKSAIAWFGMMILSNGCHDGDTRCVGSVGTG